MKSEVVNDPQVRLRVARVGDNVTTIGEVLDNPHDFILEDEDAPVGEEDRLRGHRPMRALMSKAQEMCAEELKARLLREFPNSEKEIDEIGIDQVFAYWPRKGQPPVSETT